MNNDQTATTYGARGFVSGWANAGPTLKSNLDRDRRATSP